VSRIVELLAKELPADCYVFKHSTRCPISASAASWVRSRDFDLPLYWVNVIEQRELSDWIASAYGVAHESPQLLEIRGGSVRKSLSHYDIQGKGI
jgi:bacillithiol system protein YtxJ